jgi:predicted ATPase with chaperone activity
MRHTRLTAALPIGLLALAVILSACCGGLVSAARCPQLLPPHSLPAAIAAIALASITTRTESEKRVARGVKAPPHAKALNRPICCHGTAHSQHNTPAMTGQTTGAFGADDVAVPARSSESYVFR